MTRHRETGLEACDDASCVLPAQHEGICDKKAPVDVEYTNWKNVRRMRRLSPTGEIIYTDSPPYHPESQWMIAAIDHDDGKRKLFPLAKIHSWMEKGQ